MDRYEVGEYIEHNSFGIGKVVDVENGRQHIITVAFRNRKERLMITQDTADIIHRVSPEKDQVPVFDRLPSSNSNTYIIGSQKDGNIAIKCNFCDGGSNANHIGFSGVCSDQNIKRNIEIENKVWCNNERCPCYRYYKGRINRQELTNIMATRNELVCYESTMLSDWMTQAGLKEDGETKHFGPTLHEGAVCVFTTRLPNMDEKERFIFGLFIIDKMFNGNAAKAGYVKCNTKYHIELTPDEAKQIKFWNYYRNKNIPEQERWGTGLYRFMSNQGILNMLSDLIAIRDDSFKQEVIDFMNEFCRLNNLSVPVVASNSDRPICSFSCGDTYDIAVETGIHAHPLKSGFPSKISPYIMLRAKGGISDSLYKVDDVVDLNPYDKTEVNELATQYGRVISYIKKRNLVFGFKQTTIPYRFYVLRKVYDFDPPYEIKPNPQGHRYLSFVDIGIDNPDDLIPVEELNTDSILEQVGLENDIIEKDLDKHGLEGTDRKAVVKARVNQGVFRDLLIRKYGSCCLCGTDEMDLLVASHIKPWADSTRKERVDVNNGLLLCPNHDKLFDRGYISFDDNGGILISKTLSDKNQIYMNVNQELSITMSKKTQEYMKYHRENIFIDEH